LIQLPTQFPIRALQIAEAVCPASRRTKQGADKQQQKRHCGELSLGAQDHLRYG
jgi:hypothetical protein